ncbi:MAG: hexose kinase [Christensenellaceae bacterium]|nr:hexose kinase [Christensenellaceae bacterium]
MLRVIGLNPVIDRIYYVDDFRAGTKFMLIPPHCYAGGKGTNVARVCAQMGQSVALYAFLGGASGEVIRDDLSQYGVKGIYFSHPGETRTTIDIMDLKNGRETELTEPGVAIGKEDQQAFLDRFAADVQEGDIVICSGVPMAGMDQDIFRQVALIAHKAGARTILDVDPRFFMHSMPAPFYFVKPTMLELKGICGMSADDEPSEEDVRAMVGKVMDMGVETFMLSMGSKGSRFFTKDAAYDVSIPRVKAISSIGSGDSAVAGYCIGLDRGLPLTECVKLSMACGMSNAMHGEVGFVEKAQVEEFIEGITLTRLS